MLQTPFEGTRQVSPEAFSAVMKVPSTGITRILNPELSFESTIISGPRRLASYRAAAHQESFQGASRTLGLEVKDSARRNALQQGGGVILSSLIWILSAEVLPCNLTWMEAG